MPSCNNGTAVVLKSMLLALMLVLRVPAGAQVINTVAGMYDSTGYSGDGGDATDAQIGQPNSIALDNAGNLYISDHYNNVIRKVYPSGIITTVAGIGGSSGYNGDSISATSAKLYAPYGIAVDAEGNLYIADEGNFRVRKVDTSGMITTVAGIGGIRGFGHSGDGGLATRAHMYVYDIAVDRFQNLYIADGNTSIRKVNHTTGIITTVAGGTAYGYTGNGGSAVLATMNNPTGVTVDAAGNIYIADFGNNVIRMVNTDPTPIITTIAGTGTGGYSGDGGDATSARLSQPFAVAVGKDSNLYIADMGNNRIRKVNMTSSVYTISTVAGDGTYGFSGDGGAATSAALANPSAVVTDRWGSIFIADQNASGVTQNSVIRQVSKPTVAVITSIPGNNICYGTSVVFKAAINNPVLGARYQWQYNGLNAGTDSPAFYLATPVNNDQVFCIITLPDTTSVLTTSDTITLTVNPLLTPSITIANDTNNVCSGMPVSFTASNINGGLAPYYQWLVNGIVRHTGTAFTYDPVNGDIVNCFLTSDAICATPNTATSNIVGLVINADVHMNISVISLTDSVAQGELATFIAEPTNEGLSPRFQWLINGRPVPGATSNLYNTDSLHNNDTVTCTLIGSLLCTLPLIDTSAPLIATVTGLSVASIHSSPAAIAISPNPGQGTFIIKGDFGSTGGEQIRLEIINMVGQAVYTNTTPTINGKINATIMLKDLPAGIYMVHAICGDAPPCILPLVIEK